MMTKKEEIYDEKIFPLMKQILEICKENKISLFSNFGFDPIPEDLEDGEDCNYDCYSILRGKEYESHYIYDVLDAVLQCRENNNRFNIDKFLFWVLKETKKAGSHSSIFLSQLGIDPKTGDKYKEEEMYKKDLNIWI